MTEVIGGNGKTSDIIDNADSYISDYELPEHEPRRIIFTKPLNHIFEGHNDEGNGEYITIADTIGILALPDENDSAILESTTAHEKAHAGIRNEILGPLEPEIEETLEEIDESRNRVENYIPDQYEEEIDVRRWTVPKTHPRIFSYFGPGPTHLEKIDSALESLLLEDQIIDLIDEFENENPQTEEHIREISDEYRGRLEDKKDQIQAEKERLYKPFKERDRRAKKISHPAEEAILKLFDASTPSYPREKEEIARQIDTSDQTLEDFNLDNEEYVHVRIAMTEDNYDEKENFILFDDHDKGVSDWMREFYDRYTTLREWNLSEQEAFSQVFDYFMDEVLRPYAEQELNKMQS